MRRIKQLNASEMLEVMNKYWATRSDMQKLSGKCMEYARNDFNELRKQIIDVEGKALPANLVPMEKVIEYYHINVSYLKKISRLNTNWY